MTNLNRFTLWLCLALLLALSSSCKKDSESKPKEPEVVEINFDFELESSTLQPYQFAVLTATKDTSKLEESYTADFSGQETLLLRTSSNQLKFIAPELAPGTYTLTFDTYAYSFQIIALEDTTPPNASH